MSGRGRLKCVVFLGILLVAVGLYTFIFIPSPTAHAQELTPQQRAKLQSEYDQLQQEIAQWQKVLDDTKQKKNSLQGDVTLLNAQIAKAQAEINQRNITITTLAGEIVQKTKNIATLEEQLQQGHDSLAKMLREKNEAETTSLAVLALSAQSLSDFFTTVDNIDSINKKLQDLFDELRGVKVHTQAEKDALTVKANAQQDAKHAVEATKAAVAAAKTQKNQLLAITTNQETEYKKVLAANQAKAAAIRAALFPLRDAASIQFGDALQYAQAVQKATGVEPALVLAILTQESNLGANVGQCYLTNDATGSGVGKTSNKAFAKVMHPTRDVPVFLTLSNTLGFDPHRQVVSCPIASAGGYGGAMGPAQFIPSTWAGLAKRIASARGVALANPWDPQDAIAAMSIFLDDLGADAGGYTAQHKAAAKYYAGGGWATVGQTYANQVMAKVADIQKNIDFLNNL